MVDKYTNVKQETLKELENKIDMLKNSNSSENSVFNDLLKILTTEVNNTHNPMATSTKQVASYTLIQHSSWGKMGLFTSQAADLLFTPVSPSPTVK